MKKLQNNFTTPEQSKRLLELGIPADSADCFYDYFGYRNVRDSEFELQSNFFKDSCRYYDKYPQEYTPCWSVGRLMEIYTICSDLQPTWEYRDGIIDDIIECIASDLLEQDFYFSRLEE